MHFVFYRASEFLSSPPRAIELSPFFLTFLRQTSAFRPRTCPILFFDPAFLADITTVRKFRGNRISRSQEVSTIKQTRLSKLHEITRQRSRTRHLRRNEPSGSLPNFNYTSLPTFNDSRWNQTDGFRTGEGKKRERKRKREKST